MRNLKSRQSILLTTLNESKGLEIPVNTEDFLSKKFPKYTFSSESKVKVKNAYNWASQVKVEEIPTEFEMVKTFLSSENELISEIVNEIAMVIPPVAETINVEDIPF